jgi:hypothetical protein
MTNDILRREPPELFWELAETSVCDTLSEIVRGSTGQEFYSSYTIRYIQYKFEVFGAYPGFGSEVVLSFFYPCISIIGDRTVYKLRPNAKEYFAHRWLIEDLLKEEDEDWVEFILLVEEMKEKLPFGHFYIDDYDDEPEYLEGAISVAAAELKISNNFILEKEHDSWYIKEKEKDE